MMQLKVGIRRDNGSYELTDMWVDAVPRIGDHVCLSTIAGFGRVKVADVEWTFHSKMVESQEQQFSVYLSTDWVGPVDEWNPR